mgnify:FL=1
MRFRRFLSGLLTAALVVGLLVLPPASAAGTSGFTDIADARTADAAEMLRLLGVVDGTGGTSFKPGGTLTRAEFCKMTVEIMGRGGEEPAQRSRTIFTDVGPTYWARGYVNLASSITIGGGTGEDASAGTRLIMGVGDGTFQPNRAITYGEAVTILMRVLGYSDGDVATGTNWYDGYVGLGQSSGLADGLTISGGDNITRGQAAILFYNLLFTGSKGGDQIYLTTLGGSLENNAIILSTNATADDGTTGSVLTTSGTYKTDRATFDETLNGTRGQLVLDKEKKLLAVLPEEGSTLRSVTVMGTPEANAIPVLGDETISVTLQTPVYKSDSQSADTYENVWTSLRSGTPLKLCFNGSGQLDYIYMSAGGAVVSDDNVLVAKNKPSGTSNPFASLSDGKTPQIFKNGIPADLTDLRQYDVGTYDAGSNTLFVSDLKLTGLYENAYPNSNAPSTVTVMGAEFSVLPSAIPDLAQFKVGDRMTLLLTTTGQVAGAVSTDVAKSNAVGVAKVTAGGEGSDGTAEITLLDGLITLKGSTTGSEKLNGYLVTVSSGRRGYLTLSRVNGKGASGILNLTTGRVGTKALSEGARFFEQVGNGELVEIERSDITVDTVPANKITYVGYDWAGRVDKLVLDDVTGDRYDYGMIYYRPAGPQDVEDAVPDPDTGKVPQTYQNGEIRVTNGSGQQSYVVGSVEGAKSGRYGGIAGSLDTLNGKHRLAGYVPLTSADGIRRSQIDTSTMVLTTNEMVLPISSQVQIYSEATGGWYTVSKDASAKDNLERALAFSNDMTVYYDRTPGEGGKVRIIVLE